MKGEQVITRSLHSDVLIQVQELTCGNGQLIYKNRTIGCIGYLQHYGVHIVLIRYDVRTLTTSRLVSILRNPNTVHPYNPLTQTGSLANDL